MTIQDQQHLKFFHIIQCCLLDDSDALTSCIKHTFPSDRWNKVAAKRHSYSSAQRWSCMNETKCQYLCTLMELASFTHWVGYEFWTFHWWNPNSSNRMNCWPRCTCIKTMIFLICVAILIIEDDVSVSIQRCCIGNSQLLSLQKSIK